MSSLWYWVFIALVFAFLGGLWYWDAKRKATERLAALRISAANEKRRRGAR